MHRFQVWAPKPDRVELVLSSGRHDMHPADAGWWSVDVADAGPGTRYGFSLDGGPVRPDPRSASQPDGIDGWSEVVDHAAFEWTDGQWRGVPLAGAVLYELHIGTFTAGGTFDAAIERLTHLVELGVDAIELLPVAEYSGSRGWGYDGVDLFAPHHAYGGPDGLKRFVDACHRHGLGVVMDVVYNHLGPAGNYLPEFGPYFSDRHHTNWGPAINFDGPGSDEVRRFVIDNALMWLRDFHIDGLRLDAVHAIVDDSAVHVLEELGAEVAALAAQVGRPLFLIAESDLNDPKFVRSRHAGGYGLDAAWADEWHHALHAVLTGERAGYYDDYGSIAQLAKALRQAWVYDGTWSAGRGRHHGRSPAGIEGHRFVVCAQNHDQVGNRAVGDRLGEVVGDGRLRIAAALLLTAPFTPLLFQGEEWGASTPFQYFTDHADAELGAAVSRGRRDEFGSFGWEPDEVPDPQLEATFQRSKLDWTEVDREPHAGLLAWYRTLITLRREQPDLSDPRWERVDVRFDDDERWLVVERGSCRVVVNVGDADRALRCDRPVLLAGSHDGVRVEHDQVIVPPDAVAIVASNPPG